MKTKIIIFDLDDTLYDKTGILGNNYTCKDLKKIFLNPGVKEFLHKFSGKKVLVTKETVKGLQLKKIKQLNLDHLFENIFICQNDKEKEDCFSKVLKEYQLERKKNNLTTEDKKSIVVVGDRIDSEIYYGNKLGLTTIRLKKGKYQHLEIKEAAEIPDYEIDEFEKLAEVLKK